VKSALAASPRFARQGAEAVATWLVSTIRAAQDLPLPNLSYPAEQKVPPPRQLMWRRSQPQAPKGAESLPSWMRDNKHVPTEQELDLFRVHPELAGLLEQAAVGAALADWQQSQAQGEAGDTSAVQALVDALVQQSGLTRPEIAALLTPILSDRQQRSESPRECAANTNALARLWAEISG
jgi:hypothetical protein